ncbi:voltage gated chloride channel [Protomyces lactucae-debilis]|uniref:Chloride channel protein n=1 Tax=Protomyces lactucae-debilis TaxID=2754530 RepID=A0A1Y2FNQ5_PROLT|nr:voltage gated chloride channel [Protomyces lactucae-debilis]ORY85640.1 voltage gated chloride channel [Protomyces lactucae-debilis]
MPDHELENEEISLQDTRPRATSFRSVTSFSSFLDDGRPHDVPPTPTLPPYLNTDINEVRRYGDFTTIDWVQDASREHRRKLEKQKLQRGSSSRLGTVKGWLWHAYDAGQAWMVVSLIGACIGLNAACLNILTEFLGDIKSGYCSRGWYLNKEFCCWGVAGDAESELCSDWTPWSNYFMFNYAFYIFFAIVFSSASAYLVRHFAPYAAGSGISEIKCIIGGFVMRGFLGGWTLLIKSIGLPLAIASGLSVGKEGPSVHVAVCTGNVISRLFEKYKRNAAKMREIYSACSAAGVAVAFGSPIGGVLFALEEMTTNSFPLKGMWRSFVCALIATAVLSAMDPFRTGQLVMFQVTYDRDWHFFEIFFFVILGIFGGLYGEFVMKWNLRAATFRKKYLANHGLAEAVTLATMTAIIAYWNPFLRLDMTKSMELLFQECEEESYDDMCDPNSRSSVLFSLISATILRTLFVIISYGCKVPAGIFVPSMAIGATFGRFVGILVAGLQSAFPESAFFSACKPDVPCITPGTYAFLGAAATLSGIMRITVSVVVIMFELTGALTFILPTMIVVGVTKVFSDNIGKVGGIADRMIHFNGYPFLDSKEDPAFGVQVGKMMVRDVISIPVRGMRLGEVEAMLTKHAVRGFPVVESRETRILVGYIGRRELNWAVQQAKQQLSFGPSTKCYFTTPDAQVSSIVSEETSEDANFSAQSAMSAPPMIPLSPSIAGIEEAEGFARPPAKHGDLLTATPQRQNPALHVSPHSIDFSRYIDPSPLSIHPKLPLETAMDIFKALGPRVILVQERGRLEGLISVKDILKYEHAIHNGAGVAEHDSEDEGEGYVTRGTGRTEDTYPTTLIEDRVYEALAGVGASFRTRVQEYGGIVRESLTRR